MDSVKIILPCGSRYLLDSIDVMSDMCAWTVALSFESSDDVQVRHRLQKKYPDVFICDPLDAISGIHTVGGSIYSSESAVLDKSTLNAFLKCESIALKMMDRMASINNFCYAYRVRHFYRLLAHWLAIVEKIKPDLALFQTTPHMVYDYIIYEICKYKNVNTFVIEKTPIPGLIYGMKDFRDGFVELKSRYNELISVGEPNVQLWPASEDYLNRLSGAYEEAKPIHLIHTQKIEKERKNVGILKLAIKIAKRFISLVVHGIKRDYEVLMNVLPECSGRKSLVSYLLNRAKREFVKLWLKKYYDQLCSEYEVDCPYVYFALQCQPEKSTSPLGDVFAHQYLAIKMLSQVMPKNWIILVKEHTSQFNGDKFVDKSKSKSFYDDIAAIDRVRLVPLGFNSFDLIDGAKATAVITGTVGFESVCRGKPVLIFGQNWYNGCEGVYEVSDRDELQSAIDNIVSCDGLQVRKEKIRLFVNVFQELGAYGVNNPIYESAIRVGENVNKPSLVDVLIRNFPFFTESRRDAQSKSSTC